MAPYITYTKMQQFRIPELADCVNESKFDDIAKSNCPPSYDNTNIKKYAAHDPAVNVQNI